MKKSASANSTGFRTVDTFYYIMYKRNGPNIDPCRTPHLIFIKYESLVIHDTF